MKWSQWKQYLNFQSRRTNRVADRAPGAHLPARSKSQRASNQISTPTLAQVRVPDVETPSGVIDLPSPRSCPAISVRESLRALRYPVPLAESVDPKSLAPPVLAPRARDRRLRRLPCRRPKKVPPTGKKCNAAQKAPLWASRGEFTWCFRRSWSLRVYRYAKGRKCADLSERIVPF